MLLYQTVEKSRLFKLLYDSLPDGVCPLVLPVIVEDCQAVCRWLNQDGVAAGPWWSGFHKLFDWEGFPEAKYLKEHVIAIPIHQQLNRKCIDYISFLLKKCGE
jgi:dTDP-4-amino-4,6-dideoxygalactose transaminase